MTKVIGGKEAQTKRQMDLAATQEATAAAKTARTEPEGKGKASDEAAQAAATAADKESFR